MKKIIYTLLILFAGFVFTNCDFLDVMPEGQVKEDKMFEDVQGYRDAMYGVYATMAGKELYGKRLSYEFADLLGQLFYNPFDNTQLMTRMQAYDYLNTEVRKTVDSIWVKMYQTISYTNNIIEHVKEENLDRHPDLKLIYGEALTIRAFLHFDVMRYFAPNIITHPQATGIPYAYSFNLENKDLFSLERCYTNVLADLEQAIELLEGDTELRLGEETSLYMQSRYCHANLFAAYALTARVYHYKNDLEKAAEYAWKVIGSDQFELVELANAANLNKVNKYPGGDEMIWGLYNNQLYTPLWDLFQANGRYGTNEQIWMRRDVREILGEKSWNAGETTSHDYRWDTYVHTGGEGNVFIRLLRSVNTDSSEDVALAKTEVSGVCLLRLPEMYYIVAEALYQKDRSEAIRMLELVRTSRGLTVPLPEDQVGTFEDFRNSLLDERRKDMWGEGQIFLEHKRQNKALTNAVDYMLTIEPSADIFVLPWPEDEIEYGYSPN